MQRPFQISQALSVFAFYDKSDSFEGRRAVYQVGWRDREGNRGRYEGGVLRAVPYGYMVHNGVRRKNGKSIAPRPFLSRALKIQGAKMEAVMLDAVLEVVRGRISD